MKLSLIVIFFHKLHRSAYAHFARLNSAAIRAELVAEGKDSTMGFVASVTSAKVDSIVA